MEDDKEFPVQILPHLYLGNAANSEDSQALARHNIEVLLQFNAILITSML